MLFPVAVAILLIVGTAFSNPIANRYVENLLNTAFVNEVRAVNLDPVILSDFKIEFEDKMKIIGKVKGNAEFFKGVLTGLSKAQRHSECQATGRYGNEPRIINCTISFNDLELNYDGKMKYGKMPKVSIQAKGKTKEGPVIRIEVIQIPPMAPVLRTFAFSQMATWKVEFSGLGPFNKFTKVLKDGFKSHSQAEIFNSMSQKFQFALSRAVSQISLAMI